MKKRFKAVALAAILLLLICCMSNCRPPKQRFAYARPEDKGFSSQKLDSLSAFLTKAGSSAMILMVDGEVIYEWGEIDKKHTIHSIRKPLLSALYGIKVAEGIIDTSMTLRQLKIDDLPPALSENEKEARIADLLRSRSGVYHDAAAVGYGMLQGKPDRDAYGPGQHYYYNNWDFNVLGAILEQQTGKSIYQLFKEEIALPLGMHHYSGSFSTIDGDDKNVPIPQTDGFYQYEKSKSQYPACHFRLSARDMALFGQLYLNKGQWKGRQIIPREWIEASTRPYSVTNARYGIAYGMLWKVLMENKSRKTRSFFHTGAGIHMLGIYPQSRLVLVHRVNTEADYTFSEADFYKMISLVFDAQLPKSETER